MIDLKALLSQEKYKPIPVLPIADRIIVMPVGDKQADLLDALKGKGKLHKRASGILTLGETEERILGVVVAVGGDVPLEPDHAMIGDIVYYNKYAANFTTVGDGEDRKEIYMNDIELFGRTYRHMRERDVVAVLKTTELLVLHDRVLVKPDKAITETIGNIILPDELVEVPVTGTIMQLGVNVSDNFRNAMKDEKGQVNNTRIVYHKYGGVEMLTYVGGGKTEKLLAIPETEIMAFIKD